MVTVCQFVWCFFFPGNCRIIYMSVHIYSCRMVLPLHGNPCASTLSRTFLGSCLISSSLWSDYRVDWGSTSCYMKPSSIYGMCDTVLGDLVLKHRTLSYYIWNLHTMVPLLMKLSVKPWAVIDILPKISFSVWLFHFLSCAVSISPWSWVLTAWTPLPSVYPPYVHIKGHMVYTKAYIPLHL